MNCAEFDRQLDAYLDGALAPEAAEALRRHAAGCAPCAALLGTLERGQQALMSVRPRPAPPGMLAAVHARLEQQHRRWRWAPLWRMAMVAAPVAAAVVAMVIFRPPAPPLLVEEARSSVPPASLAPSPPGPPQKLMAFGIGADGAIAGGSGASPARRPRRQVRAPSPRRPPPRPVAPPRPAEARISPALMRALNRPVSVVAQDRPLGEVASQLAEEADVPVRVVGDAEQRVSLQAQQAPLWLALQAMAEQAGARIEPRGDGVLLRVEPRLALRQTDGATPRQAPLAQQMARAPRQQTWSPEFGRLPERQFALGGGGRVENQRSASANAAAGDAAGPTTRARTSGAPTEPAPPAAGGLAAPTAPQAAPPDRDTTGSVRGQVAEAHSARAALAPTSEVRLQRGEIAIFRVEATYGALQVLGRAGDGLRYRLWVKHGDGRLDRGARTLRLATSARPGPLAIPSTAATIAWSVDPSGVILLRAGPPVELAPTVVRTLRNLDVATLWPR